jgi:integrase
MRPATHYISTDRQPWNKGKSVGPKPPLKIEHVQAIKLRLRMADRKRDLAMFCLALDSKLRASDVVRLTVADVAEHRADGELRIRQRGKVVQQKTGTDVAFEISPDTQACLRDRITNSEKLGFDALFTSLRA